MTAGRVSDPDGLRDAYLRWSPLVHSLALESLDDPVAAERVTAQVFRDLRDAFDDERRGRSDLRVVVDLACARIADRSGGGESNLTALAERLVVADVLAHLDDARRSVLRMVLDGCSTAEVARRTGSSVEEVRSQVASGLVELRMRWEVPADARRA